MRDEAVRLMEGKKQERRFFSDLRVPKELSSP